jgi:hypothetical protein
MTKIETVANAFYLRDEFPFSMDDQHAFPDASILHDHSQHSKFMSRRAFQIDLFYNSLCSCPSPSVSAITVLAASTASATLLDMAAFTPSVALSATLLAVFSMIDAGFSTPAMPINSVSKTEY